MKIVRARVSASLKYFERGFMENYGLVPVQKHNQPVIMFGMYRLEDYCFFQRHKAPIIVVWCGTDSMRISPIGLKMLRCKYANHIATHDFGSADLKAHGIDHKVYPITPGKIDLQLEPRGDKVYFYGAYRKNYLYGGHMINEIEQRTGIPIIRAESHTYNKEELKQVYKDCFLALRLTTHDGVPTTVLEMGFMGRKSVFNGSVPHCIRWNSVKDVCDIIKAEYETRHEDNAYIAEDIRKFINIGDQWQMFF